MSTAIEWTDETWNPVTGCTKVSPGCDNCYAERVTNRWKPGSFDTVTLHPERLDKPLHWRKPRRVFVNSMADLFHDDVPDEFIARVFVVMAMARQHTFQVLTKRHARMRSLLLRWESEGWAAMHGGYLPNVWLGVSVEDQQWADIRIPALLDTPAAVRFLSCEPLLGPIDLWQAVATSRYACHACEFGGRGSCNTHRPDRLDWVIVGGESGPKARLVYREWVADLRDQCVAASVPFFFKQWGGKTPKAGGAVLDGREWREMPGELVSA